jgi:hypothetical protein
VSTVPVPRYWNAKHWPLGSGLSAQVAFQPGYCSVVAVMPTWSPMLHWLEKPNQPSDAVRASSSRTRKPTSCSVLSSSNQPSKL